MLRSVDLPEQAEVDALTYHIDADGVLTAQMPLHLPPRRDEPPPGVVPIVTDADGRRLIRFAVPIGPDFAVDEVAVDVDPAARQVRRGSEWHCAVRCRY